MTHEDGRARAHKNELRILRALHRFGWLRTRDLAAIVWLRWRRSPDGPPRLQPATATPTGLRMAQRTLCRLRDKRLVLTGHGPDGSTVYALSERGARLLQQIGVKATTGKDTVRPFSAAYFRHRCIANEIAIGAIVDGFRVATEREIAQGRWIGGKDGIAGKLPDVFVRGAATAWWVEVERSRKNATDYMRLLVWLNALARPAASRNPIYVGPELSLGRVVFICTPPFQARLCRDLAAAGWSTTDIDTALHFETSLYSVEVITFS